MTNKIVQALDGTTKVITKSGHCILDELKKERDLVGAQCRLMESERELF